MRPTRQASGLVPKAVARVCLLWRDRAMRARRFEPERCTRGAGHRDKRIPLQRESGHGTPTLVRDRRRLLPLAYLRRKGIRPHIAQIENRSTPGLDARTTRRPSYWVSQKKRKRVEEIFGWMKSYGG